MDAVFSSICLVIGLSVCLFMDFKETWQEEKKNYILVWIQIIWRTQEFLFTMAYG